MVEYHINRVLYTPEETKPLEIGMATLEKYWFNHNLFSNKTILSSLFLFKTIMMIRADLTMSYQEHLPIVNI